MHIHDYFYNRHPESYKPLIDFIRECQHKRARLIAILDVGRGTGIFREVLEINLREKKKRIIVTVFEANRFSKK